MTAFLGQHLLYSTSVGSNGCARRAQQGALVLIYIIFSLPKNQLRNTGAALYKKKLRLAYISPIELLEKIQETHKLLLNMYDKLYPYQMPNRCYLSK